MWRPSGRDAFAPAGAKAKAAANIAALRTLRDLETSGRSASDVEQAVLARWSGWGALPKVFDEDAADWTDVRAEVRSLLSDDEWAAARRTTLNAHYTDPDLVGELWQFLIALGFDGGRVLEPGCGSGNFIGLTPAGVPVDWTGVELDPVTARICALLYPNAVIRAEGFEASRFEDGSFDAAVGNVPFGKITLFDPTHNRARETMHNHFIIKSLHLVRPGGLVAVITSRYTMDARNPQARATMAELAELVTAIRLPASTHRQIAGADVVTDLVVFRRRQPGTGSPDAGRWHNTTELSTQAGPVQVNEWFVDHPELILGEPRLHGSYRSDDLDIVGTFDPMLLRRVLAAEAVTAEARDQRYVPATARPTSAVSESSARGGVGLSARKPGSVIILRPGEFGRVVDGRIERHDCPATDVDELTQLCLLRDVLVELLEVQATTMDDDRVAALQQELASCYDIYVDRWGPLNRYRWGRTGRTDPDTGEEIMRRLRPKMGGFRDDPDAPSVLALENFDPATQRATKAAVFTQRVLAPREPRRGTDDPAEAVLLCLDQDGEVTLARAADLLGVDEESARSLLGETVFADPERPGRLVPAGEYLSGDVRAKRDAAATAAEQDDRFGVNVAALDAVLPADLTADEIDVRPGQSWIPTDLLSAFVVEVLGADDVTVAHDELTAQWEIDVPAYQRGRVAMTSEWGTDRKDAVALLQATCNQTAVRVYDVVDERSVLNKDATLDAREKQQQLVARFASWIWEDPARRESLLRVYNDRFNSHVPRRYSGEHLTLPGLASTFTPRAHQRAAVERILSEPSVLLAHEVGAGKTATMVIAAMELRRLGLARKPMVVVPNHMLEQFCTEWRALYPTANVLFPTDVERSPSGRKHFVARAAVGDWDAVVIDRSTWERIPLSPATEASFLDGEADSLRKSMQHFKDEIGRKSRTVKYIENRTIALREKSKALLHRSDKDDGATFEQLGVDYLFVDEAHEAKNLAINTRLAGLSKRGSGFATQLDVRLRWLRQQYGSKIVTLATATPIANSLSEMWVMQHYATPELLSAAGVAHFDAWASNFAAEVTRLELAPEGTHYRLVTRLARFRNVPDLGRMFTVFADIRTKADLDLPVPALRDDRPEVVVVDGSDELHDFVAGLGDRAEAVRGRAVDPTVDNMLNITNDGRAAALDMRLVDPDIAVADTKVTAAAERISEIWEVNRDRVYLDSTGQEHPRTGALQLVFAELGTPGSERWGLYEQLRGELTTRGVPADRVRFIHEAKNPRDKEQLFAACRNGAVAVLIGTTAKMGIGTNVQARCVALHHLDCPWRPADVEQREGRILRQGNQNPQVEILRYVTEGSFDVYMWQTVEMKAGFIHQVLSGRLDGRQLDDVAGEQELSYAEVKALATGDDRIVRRANLEAETAGLRRQRSAHYEEQARLRRTITRNVDRTGRLRRQVAELDRLVAGMTPTRGNQFTMTIDGRTHNDRGHAGDHLAGLVNDAIEAAKAGRGTARQIGDLGGVGWELRCQPVNPTVVELVIPNTPALVRIDRARAKRSQPGRLVQSLEHELHDLPARRDTARGEIEDLERETIAARDRLDVPFARQEDLDELEAQLATLTAELSGVGSDEAADRDLKSAPSPPGRGLGR